MSTTARRSIAPILLFCGFTLLLCALAWVLCRGRDSDASHAALVGEMESAAPESRPSPIPCIVIDAGHGGEDGGTSSAAGLVEKEVNLSVALALRDLCEAAGIPVVMTRVEDVLLYDRNVDFHGRKKVLDLAARRIVAEKTAAQWGDCLFVSIHMNAFPQPQYSGMQVWYSTADPRSAEVAESIQRASTTLMPDNTRRIKDAGSNIYLLDRIKTPAVLVECGFLSNPPEAERLSDECYRRALAVLIFSAVAPYLGSGS